MNEKKKGFNLFPEYVWMIFVGMLLALLILTNVIPGHAGEVSSVAGSSSVAFSYESSDHPEYVYTSPFRTGVTLDSQGYYNWPDPPQKVFASDDYGVNYTSVINATRFTNDVKLIKGHVGFNFAGTSLIHVSKANFTGYLPGTVQESWYEDFQEAGYTYFGCDLWAFPGDDSSSVPQCIGYILIKFSDNEIPVLSKVNRIYDQEFFQIDFDESKVVETLTYFNEYSWYYWGLDFPNDVIGWFKGSHLGYDGLVDHSGSEHVRVYVKTVNRGDFYFDHVSYNEQYTQNYKYRANVECLDFHREADPEEPDETSLSYFVTYFRPYFSSLLTGYYLFKIEGSGLGSELDVPDSATYNAVSSAYSVYNPFKGFVFLNYYRNDSGSLYVYFPGFDVSVSYTFLGTFLPDGTCSEIAEGKTFYSVTNGSNGLTLYSSGGLNCIRIQHSTDNFQLTSFYKFDVPFYKVASPAVYSTNTVFEPINSADVKNPYYQALVYGLTGDVEPTPNPEAPTPSLMPSLSPTPSPSATPVPLPTSGESIHVILPTGTPTPTPPFTVSGGSDGSGGSGSGSGSGSPGSIGSGLSSGQTSGVLQAWNLYVSDNPAMLFLTSTFQSLPPELLYPLYILLFILLLLAVIRLFVHFSGG